MKVCADRITEREAAGKCRGEGKAESAVLLAACLVFYLWLPVMDGYVWCKDSLSYTTMDISREPLYPTFLALLRALPFPWGEDGYLYAAVVLQSLLAAYTAWRLGLAAARIAGGVQKDPCSGRARLVSRMMMAAGAASQWMIVILTRFIAQRGSSYQESIMTEGLGLSLYVLFLLQLWRWHEEGKKRNLLLTVCMLVILISLRKQLLVAGVLFALAAFVLDGLVRRAWRRFLYQMLAIILVMASVAGLDCAYNAAVRGVWMQHTGNSMGALCTLLYISDEEDAARIEDETLREEFTAIWQEADRQGLLMADAGENPDWVMLTTHYADSYDAIGYGILHPVLLERIDAEDPSRSDPERYQRLDEQEMEMRNALLTAHPDRFFKLWVGNLRKGLVNSVARENTILNWCALGLYAVYLGLSFYLLRFRRERAVRSVLLFAGLVLGGIVLNCVVVGAVIFPQPRYMIYSMGLFYTALALLLHAAWKCRRTSPAWR
ncbi:MAG: hypothetical protein Q4C60_02520 [Eubacteriales bacterium]|nr:hypothetical protein [Eubacteriales bacterium]